MFDDEMILKNKFSKGEMFGINQFLKFCEKNYDLINFKQNLDDIIPVTFNTKFIKTVQQKMNKSSVLFDLKENVSLKSCLTMLGSNDVKYI